MRTRFRLNRSSVRRGVARLIVCAAALLAVSCAANNWPHWRGPNLDGVSGQTGLPEDLTVPGDVLWTTPMPGVGAATPVVYGDRVYVASMDGANEKTLALCLNAATGDILWQHETGNAPAMPRLNTAASCSPVADGRMAVFLFGSSDLVAFTPEGKKLWHKDLESEAGEVTTKFGYSSSPLLYDGRVYVSVLRLANDPSGRPAADPDQGSYVICVDAGSGETVWKHHRPSDATGESQDAYTSPILYERGGRTLILVTGADYISGYVPETGEEVWRCDYNPRRQDRWRLVPTPVVHDGVIYGVQPRGVSAFAITPPEEGTKPWSEALWTYESTLADVPAPLYYEGRLYIISDRRKTMTCLDPDTGALVWEHGLGGKPSYYASPTAADGKIFCMSRAGELSVLAAGDSYRELGRAEFGAPPCDASVAIAQGRMYIRTADKLYCLGRY